MNKKRILLLLILSGLLSACEGEKNQQMIIPQAQLDALQKAKALEENLLKAQQQQDADIKELGL